MSQGDIGPTNQCCMPGSVVRRTILRWGLLTKQQTQFYISTRQASLHSGSTLVYYYGSYSSNPQLVTCVSPVAVQHLYESDYESKKLLHTVAHERRGHV